jgi:hypothetical protein
VSGPGLEFLVGWSGQAKEAIGLGLEGGAATVQSFAPRRRRGPGPQAQMSISMRSL